MGGRTCPHEVAHESTLAEGAASVSGGAAPRITYVNLQMTLAIVGVLTIALSGCARKPAPPAPPLPTVTTSIAVAGSVTPAQTLPGIIAPYQNVAIQSTLSEPADSVRVQEGDHIRTGQLLAQLDTADLEANLRGDLASARSDAANTSHLQFAGSLAITQGVNSVSSSMAVLTQAKKTLANDQLNLTRDQQLYKNGYIALQVLQQQQTLVVSDQQTVRNDLAALDSAQTTVQANGTMQTPGLQTTSVQQSQATEQYELSQANQIRVMIGRARIVSPVNGVVVNRALNPGEYPGTRQLFTLQQTDPLFAIVRGSGEQIAKMRQGAPADVYVNDVRPTPFHGTVAAVLNQVNPGSTDFIVKVLLRNPSGEIRPGMSVTTNITMPTLHGIRIPTTAFASDTNSCVLAVRNGVVATIKVHDIGGDGTTSVVSGLAPGTRVISNGQSGFADGQQVAVR
jgi:multidrug efflux pump subunit AcrA (membrane-fusion protein)